MAGFAFTPGKAPDPSAPEGLVEPVVSLSQDRELRADLLWGASGHGKDTQIWFAAYYVASKYKKRTLLLTGESIGTGLQAAEKAGLVDVISIAALPKPMDMVAAIIKGRKWPVKVYKKSGMELDFNSREAAMDGDRDGLFVVNSMTSMGDSFNASMTRDGTVRLPMQAKEEHYKVTIDKDIYRSSAPTFVGFIHDRMYEYVVWSTYLPITKVLWTAREKLGAIGEKKDREGNIIKQGIPVFGPELPGSAATHRVTSWFGGAYHLDKVEVGAIDDSRNDALATTKDKMKVATYEYRLYLERHKHPKFDVPYDVKNRLPAFMNAALPLPTGPTGGKPYIVCTETPTQEGWIHTGLNTVWALEEGYVEAASAKMAGMLTSSSKNI